MAKEITTEYLQLLLRRGRTLTPGQREWWRQREMLEYDLRMLRQAREREVAKRDGTC